MASAVRKLHEKISEEAYFELEKRTDTRHEFIDGDVYAMVGGSFNHGRLARNIAYFIGGHLKGKNCEMFSESTKVKVPNAHHSESRYFYPDVVVDCSIDKIEIRFFKPKSAVSIGFVLMVFRQLGIDQDFFGVGGVIFNKLLPAVWVYGLHKGQ